ncbi:MAG TPA: hypothetical protein VHP14_02925 [Anaerolineales bacterium]|nr:hypothetical protein [Anaerolineales bacterium]
MNLDQVIKELDLTLLTDPKDFADVEISAGYTSDLLSCVMSGAPRQGLWVTLQAHTNIVAVAALLDLSAVVITESATPDANTIDKANHEGITLLSTHWDSFHVVGKLWELGLRAK